MLFRKLWRTMGLFKAQFISMIIMVALGIGIFVGFNMEWVSIRENTGRFFDETGLADYSITSDSGFSSEQVEKVKKISGVDSASRYLSVVADVKEKKGDSVALTVTEDMGISGIMVTQGAEYDKNSTDGIWLSETYANANNIKTGDDITLVYKNIEISGTVKGLGKSGEYLVCVRDETQLMPDPKTYGFAYISPAAYKKAAGVDFYPMIKVCSDLEKKEFTNKVDKALDSTTMILTKDENNSYASAKGEAEEGQTMGAVLPILFLLIALLTMITTMHRLTVKEKTQIGTLKALGFKDSRILIHYTSYAFVVGLMGSVLGIALGYGVAYYIMNPGGMMGTYMDMPYWHLYLPGFCSVTVALVIVLLTFIGFLSTRKMLKGTAADALRPYTPKKMKPMIIERTRLFHKLPFGTRWNLRDIVRHKSRTAMSLLGIIGCMTLTVAALGMKDTMALFMDTYYNEATKYESRIYLSEDATAVKRDDIIKKYDGDSSASLGVQLEEKAVSLDIYDLNHGYVRFPGEDNEYAELKDNGAYICRRISEKFNLAKGDTFEISPYGSDKIYTMKVAGTIRSVSENIVISAEYAKKQGISYVPDSVYTKTDKAKIKLEGCIKSVQSKQMIIDSFDSFTSIMNSSVYLLVAGAMVLGIVVLYNLGVMSYTERYREMATLKVVGFRDRQIAGLLISQNLWVSILGIVVGIPLGTFTLSYMVLKLASEYEMVTTVSLYTYIISILLTLGMSLLVSLMVARKNRQIDMVEALKFAE